MSPNVSAPTSMTPERQLTLSSIFSLSGVAPTHCEIIMFSCSSELFVARLSLYWPCETTGQTKEKAAVVEGALRTSLAQ